MNRSWLEAGQLVIYKVTRRGVELGPTENLNSASGREGFESRTSRFQIQRNKPLSHAVFTNTKPKPPLK